MRIWFLILAGVLAVFFVLMDSDAPELYACPPSSGHHSNPPYGSGPRPYVYDDLDAVLLGRDLSLDCNPNSQCMEFHTDYKNLYDGLCQRSVGFPSDVEDEVRPGMLEPTECGKFCFYAVCLDCTLTGHLHPLHPHTHRHCSDCSRHTHWHRQPTVYHSYEVSSCTDWHWRLYDPTVAAQVSRKDGRYDRDDFSAPVSMTAAMEFGMVPDGYVPPTTDCIDETGDAELFDYGHPLALGVPLSDFGDNDHQADIMTGVRDRSVFDQHPTRAGMLPPFEVGDLSHLPGSSGEAGAPILVSVTKVVDDRTVILNVSGGHNTQYRYWSYNGIKDIEKNTEGRLTVGPDEGSPLIRGGWNPGRDEEHSPNVFRVPFVSLSGRIVIRTGIRGIVSFQVRSVDDAGVPSNLSNIEHTIIGLGGLRAIGPDRVPLPFALPLPPPPPPSTPLPTPSVPGVVLPPKPVIGSVAQVVDAVGTIEIALGGDYGGYVVEYRVWDHSGFDPWDVDEVPVMSVPWFVAPVTSGSFQVMGIVAGLEFPLYDTYGPLVPPRIIPPPGPFPTATPSFTMPTPAPWPTYGPPVPAWVQVPFPTPEPTPSFPTPTPVPTRAPIPVPPHFNVQLRLINSQGLPGDPSDTKVVRVWTGLYTGWDQ